MMNEWSKRANLYSLLSSPVRLHLLHLLLSDQDLDVTELVARVGGKEQPTISQHLHLLRLGGIVDFTKIGLHCYYNVKPEWRETIRNLLIL